MRLFPQMLPHRLGFACLLGILLLAQQAHSASVTTYGANGADANDDTTAFQSCLDNNTLCDVPPGTYYISLKLQFPSGRTLRGTGSLRGDVTLRLVGAIDGLDIGGASNVRVENLTMDRATSDTARYGVTVGAGSNISVRNIDIVNHRSTRSAMIFNNTTSATVENCNVLNYCDWDNTLNQVNGQGIRFSDVINGTIRHNTVIEYRNLIQAGATSNFYQAGAIEISDSQNTLVENNTIVTAGNGIDAGGASNCTIRYNTIRNIHEVAVKLVNGAHDNTVFGNVIEKCGIAGIWLTPGSPGPSQAAIYGNSVRENLLLGVGLGIAEDYWTTSFRPAGIILEGSNNTASVVANNNLVADNLIEPTRKLVNAVIEYNGFTFDPFSNTLTNNQMLPAERDDYGFFRPAFGAGLWRAVINAGGSPPDIDGTAGDFSLIGLFGNASASDLPLVGDVNGDGADDRVIYNSATQSWIWDSAPRTGQQASGGYGDGVAEQAASVFGQPGDQALLGDIDGDGAADRVLFRPSDQSWHVDFSQVPIYPYDPAAQGFGDGIAEPMGGTAIYNAQGATITRAVLSDYDDDRIADRTIYSVGSFYRTLSPGGADWSFGTDHASVGVGLGNASFTPPPFLGDFDSDALSDNIAWTGGTVYARLSGSATAWSDTPTVTGNNYGDPGQDLMFLGNFDRGARPVPVELSAFSAE